MKHSWWQSFQPLLEHFLMSNLCMLYVIWKLRKSTIQCFKPCVIWIWNEEVTAFGRQLLQAEGRLQKSAAESALLLRDISQHFCTVLWISPEASRRDGSQTPQDGSQFREGVEAAGCYEEISQPLLCICKISQTSFSPAKRSWSFPIVATDTFGYFASDFLMSEFPFSPCNPPIIGFLSY